MKIPLSPPTLGDLLSRVGPDRLGVILPVDRSDLVDGRYLHWDDLRHRAPPEGLTIEEWWLGVKLARLGRATTVPLLRDKGDRPFTFGMPERVQRELHRIDRDAAGQIGMATPVAGAADRDRYLLKSLVEEAITSSQLEGAATTRRVAEAMLREGRSPRDRGEHMIFNNFAAMQRIRDICREPLSPRIVLDLHRTLTANTLDDPTDAGRLRESDDVRVVDHRDGTVLHEPPAPGELPERIERLCEFANGNENDSPYVHPVIRAILLHFMIGYDHPFVDGNGRTARALFYWSMARQGYWLTEYLSISRFLRRAPAQYVNAYLQTETDGGDATYFIVHQLNVIRRAIDELRAYLRRKGDEERTTERLLRESATLRGAYNHRQIALLTHAIKHPGAEYTVEGHRRSHNSAYATARADLLKLSEDGLLAQHLRGKAFVFVAPENLRERMGERVR